MERTRQRFQNEVLEEDANSLGAQMRRRVARRAEEPVQEATPSQPTISTGSTLLDLAISGQSELGGGLPGGILVEVFGPSGTGKTVLLSEIAGGVRRQGGNVMFHDPEARLNGQFAKMFGLDMDDITYSKPDTIVEVFKSIREWDPGSDDVIHGVFADSLAALTTDAELAETDKYGMRRAKEFSEQLRLTCRVLAAKGMLLVCSNQIRQNPDAGPYGQKFKSPGGEAIGFYSSVRLRTASPSKLKKEVSVRGRKHSMVVGVEVDIEVHKNSLAAPYHRVPVMIRFDYGIDDVTANLQFIKTNTNATKYQVAGTSLAVSLEQSAQMVEEQELEQQLASEVRQLWLEIQGAFGSGREKRRS